MVTLEVERQKRYYHVLSSQTRPVCWFGAWCFGKGGTLHWPLVWRRGWRVAGQWRAKLPWREVRTGRGTGVTIVLLRIPQAQLQRCCRGQKRFWVSKRKWLLDKPSSIRHFLTTAGGGQPLTPGIKVQGDATAATQPARAGPLADCAPTAAATTTRPHTLQFHPHCSVPLNRKKKPWNSCLSLWSLPSRPCGSGVKNSIS